MTNPSPTTGITTDPRFQLHHVQPRANKLDAQQRRLCNADAAFREALRGRVRNADRFTAFLAGATSYIVLGSQCHQCGSLMKRTRDRSCHGCHLSRGRPNFERIKAGVPPIVARNLDSHLDLLERAKAEREGEFAEMQFEGLTARRLPMGRLAVTFPDGHHEDDLGKLRYPEIINAIAEFPMLRDALRWAGWTVPG
ncbi:hypothetical protein U1839_21710 [Sphingomonas sp. RT2P30]